MTVHKFKEYQTENMHHILQPLISDNRRYSLKNTKLRFLGKDNNLKQLPVCGFHQTCKGMRPWSHSCLPIYLLPGLE